MDHLSVEVAPDHLESLTKLRKPIVAIEELIWNSLDADATTVDVSLARNQLEGLEVVRVKDNGHGIHRNRWREAFGTLGGSPKLKLVTTPKGRHPHGKAGRGRFKAFGLGDMVVWRSRYRDNGRCLQFEITGKRSTIRDFDATDAAEVQREPGVEVEIVNIPKNYPSLCDRDNAALELARRLALYLRQYPGITIRYDGVPVDPASLEEHVATYPLEVSTPQKETLTGELTVIEWKCPTERALYLCDQDGFAREEQPPGIQAKGFDFTAYLKSPFIAQLDEDNALALGEMNPSLQALLDCAKSALRLHFRKREALRAADLVKRWQAENIYPYHKPTTNPIEQAEREVFDVCAVKVYEYSPSFDAADQKNKQLIFRLIREALESNPTSLQAILREVLTLPQEQQDELAAILEKTRLAAIINAARLVMDRLGFLAGLDPLLFGEYKKGLNEPHQLHRILADELWLFGEHYALGVDEESLKNLLKAHMRILGRDELVEDVSAVTDLDGKDRRLDLMLYRRYPQTVPNCFEHLVVELKRPTRKLGKDEISQIKEYAFAVSESERFDKKSTRWTFLLVGNNLDRFAENECNVKDRQFGHIYAGDINIYVRRWATVIDEARWRYEFFRQKLECQVTTADGLEYLRRKHKDRLPNSPETQEQ